MNVFQALKFITINHQNVSPDSVALTDLNGKPNAVMTDLLHDILTKIYLFVDLDSIEDVGEMIAKLARVTPLPQDVLDEYEKALEQAVYQVNFATKKNLVEIVYDDFVWFNSASLMTQGWNHLKNPNDAQLIIRIFLTLKGMS